MTNLEVAPEDVLGYMAMKKMVYVFLAMIAMVASVTVFAKSHDANCN